MTENAQNSPIPGSFMWIKQTLDPRASYIIFENDRQTGTESIFDRSHMAYAFFEARAFTWRQVMDEALHREYLVLCIGTGNEDQVLGQVMGYGFPKETVYYLYKAQEA